MNQDLLKLVKQPRFLAAVIELFLDGKTMGKLTLNKNLADTSFTKFHQNLTQVKINKKLKLSMLESVHLSKKMILNVKNSSFKLDFQLTKLLMILDQVLILNEEDFCSFYNLLSKQMLKKLSFQAKIGYVDSDLNLLNGYANNTIQNSWFSNQIKNLKNNNSSTMFCQSSKFTLANGMEKEDIQLKVKKIKLRLTSNQKTLLQKWNEHHRFTYNSTVWRLNTDIDKLSKLNYRNEIVPVDKNKGKEWMLTTPKEVRARAVFEAYTRWVTTCKQVKNKTIKFFNLGYKEKKYQDANGWCIDIQKQSIQKKNDKELFIYKKVTNKETFHLRNPLTIEIRYDCKIYYDGLNYYFIVPYKDDNVRIRDKDNGIIALDPGVRTFLSGVDHQRAIEIGNGSGTIMFKLLRRLDDLISKRTKCKKRKKKQQYSKEIKSVRRRIKNKQEELHKKTSTWLCKNYSSIVIPHFGSKEMVKKKDRKLRTKSVRAMTMLGHCKFLERLKMKAKEWKTNVIEVDEKYTSKTCSACGNVKTKRFTSKTYVCENCNVCIDRDTNGAINILKKLFM